MTKNRKPHEARTANLDTIQHDIHHVLEVHLEVLLADDLCELPITSMVIPQSFCSSPLLLMRRKCLMRSIRFGQYGRHFSSDAWAALPIAPTTTDLTKGGAVSRRPTTCMIMSRYVPIVSCPNSSSTSSVALRDLVVYALLWMYGGGGMIAEEGHAAAVMEQSIRMVDAEHAGLCIVQMRS